MKKITKKKIKAAILVKIKKPLVIKKLEMPNIGDNQVLVKIFYSGICQSQIIRKRARLVVICKNNCPRSLRKT